MKYQLEIKQLVDYPRCRIYRSFIRNLMEDRNIRTNGGSYLFYYIVLCSYANYRLKVCLILCRQVNGSARFQNYRKRFVSASITR